MPPQRNVPTTRKLKLKLKLKSNDIEIDNQIIAFVCTLSELVVVMFCCFEICCV